MVKCIEFTGRRRYDGYGVYSSSPYKDKYAHRVAWEQAYGKIPEGMFVCHKCDNRICINVQHLFLGTQKDNILDMMNKNRHARLSGEKHGMNKYSEDLVKLLIELRQSLPLPKKNGHGGVTTKAIAEMVGIPRTTASAIVNGYNWKHLNG